MTVVQAYNVIPGMTLRVTPIQLWVLSGNEVVSYDLMFRQKHPHINIELISHLEVDVVSAEPSESCNPNLREMIKIVYQHDGGPQETVLLLADEAVMVSSYHRPGDVSKNHRKRARSKSKKTKPAT